MDCTNVCRAIFMIYFHKKHVFEDLGNQKHHDVKWACIHAYVGTFENTCSFDEYVSTSYFMLMHNYKSNVATEIFIHTFWWKIKTFFLTSNLIRSLAEIIVFLETLSIFINLIKKYLVSNIQEISRLLFKTILLIPR